MPKYISENGQLYILYDNCEEYIHLGPDPQYENSHAGPVFRDIELSACCEGTILDKVPLTPTPTMTVSPSITPSLSPTVTISVTPSVTPTISNSATPTPTVSITSTNTPTPSITATSTPTVTPSTSNTPSITPSSSVTPTLTPTISISATTTPTLTPTATTTPTLTPTISITPSNTPTVSVSPSATPSATPTLTPTPTSLFDNPNVDVIYLTDENGNPYELFSIDYNPNNANILAVAVPRSNYTHNIISHEIPGYPSDQYYTEGNMLVATDSYFASFIYKQKIVETIANTSSWNYDKYPANRVSSVYFDNTLNRWFVGCQVIDGENLIFLYGHNNGGFDRFFIGGNSSLAVNDSDQVINGLSCGPTKIFSVDNSVYLANSDMIYMLLTTDTTPDPNTSTINYTHKFFAHKCKDITNCGIERDIPDDTAKFYHNLPTIVHNANAPNQDINILYNPIPLLENHIDSQPHFCDTSSFYRGYNLTSYDLSVDVSFALIQSHAEILFTFNKNIPIDINNVSVKRNNQYISPLSFIFGGSSNTYTLNFRDDELLDKALRDKTIPYWLEIRLDDSNLPSELNIPLYNADLGFDIKHFEFDNNKNKQPDTLIFIANPQNQNSSIDETYKYYASSSSNCDTGYIYRITNSNMTDQLMCLPLPGSHEYSSIKSVLAYGQWIYTLLQIEPDPLTTPAADGVFHYNLYRAPLNNPASNELMLYNIQARRYFRDAEYVPSTWTNTCMIDSQYIIVGIPNSNTILKINYNALPSMLSSPIALPLSYTGEPIINIPGDVDDRACLLEYDLLNCNPCIFGSSDILTGQCSDITINGFKITYTGFKANRSYFILEPLSDSLNGLIEGEPITLSMTHTNLNINEAYISYISRSKGFMIIQCSSRGLENELGYGCNTVTISKSNTRSDFIP